MDDCALVRVALPVPLPRSFDYEIGGPPPPVGARVRVPFGRSERVGIVLEHPTSTAVAASALKRVRAVLDDRPVLGPELLELLLWAARYYHHPVGEVVTAAIPSWLRTGHGLDPPPTLGYRLTAAGRKQHAATLAARAPRQAQVLAALTRCASATAGELAAEAITPDVLRRLEEKGWLERVVIERGSGGSRPQVLEAGPEPNPDQHAAITAVRNDDSSYRAYLLQGVTGSGKTEVYMALMRDALGRGAQSLLLVPEIGLTPQLVGRLRKRFGAELAVLHSALSDKERFDAWRRAHSGDAHLVVGTRSAVFASMPRLGLIIVDEEHDPSFKQQTGFRYSARDLAIVRAQRLGIKVMLGSATPSLESLHNARSGRYAHLSLPQRIGGAREPTFRTIDLNRHPSKRSLSVPLIEAVSEHIGRGHQVILFLNRRGFAPALFCPTCLSIETCKRCDANLTVHSRAGKLRCHHCGHESPLTWLCDRCGTERIGVGAGTERVGDEVGRLWPDTAIARLDRDTVSARGELDRILSDFARGKTRILVGTQMLTKGHDFPNVTLVGVLNADQGLFGTDFRSEERLAQTILQVGGRAGRREAPGTVLIQSHYPDHPLLKCLLEHGYGAFAELALDEREKAGWPPFSHLALVRAEAHKRTDVFRFLTELRRITEGISEDVGMLGPAPAAMERRSGRFRGQLMLLSRNRRSLHARLDAVLAEIQTNRLTRRVRWALDVDPIEA